MKLTTKGKKWWKLALKVHREVSKWPKWMTGESGRKAIEEK